MRIIIVRFYLKVIMSNVVVLSDDPQSGLSLTEVLSQNTHQVTCFSDAETTLDFLQQQNVDLILLDHHLFSPATLQLITTISKRFAIPILLLSELSEQANVLDGLQAGADQYMIKPFSAKALLVHIDALLRRVTLEKQRLAFQHCSKQFSFKVARLPLTETEVSLVQYLSKNDGDIVSKATLQKEVLKRELSAFDRNLDVHISNIRRKMFNAGLSKSHIKTVHGKGYAFSEKVSQLSCALMSFL
tara:strand:+ start:180 stop:911 length:732 start_codon:yes stop_codon:yes gene_type:complete